MKELFALFVFLDKAIVDTDVVTAVPPSLYTPLLLLLRSDSKKGKRMDEVNKMKWRRWRRKSSLPLLRRGHSPTKGDKPNQKRGDTPAPPENCTLQAPKVKVDVGRNLSMGNSRRS